MNVSDFAKKNIALVVILGVGVVFLLGTITIAGVFFVVSSPVISPEKRAIVAAVKRGARDPDSVRIISWDERYISYKGPAVQLFRMEAKNGLGLMTPGAFGAVMLEDGVKILPQHRLVVWGYTRTRQEDIPGSLIGI